MKPVSANTKRNVLRFVKGTSNGRCFTSHVMARIKEKGYEWPYKGVYEKHVVLLLEDLGLHKLDCDVFPFHVWAVSPPTPQEKAAKFLAWAEDNKRSGGYGCCDSHHEHAEGFNEATDDLVERLKSEFPEIFTAVAAG